MLQDSFNKTWLQILVTSVLLPIINCVVDAASLTEDIHVKSV